jgi:Zn-dependent peptidase ImmA (M78 family)
MVQLRRGFKAEAETIAREVRADLGLAEHAPLDVRRLAEHLAIPLLPLNACRQEEPAAVRHFRIVDTGAFSAGTIFRGRRRLIVFNDAHAVTRQASDLAHELAHALLQHAPGAALDNFGCRVWSDTYESEADWLGGALLVPELAALLVARSKQPVSEAAATYGVSQPMMQYRLNVTGAFRRAGRQRRR